MLDSKRRDAGAVDQARLESVLLESSLATFKTSRAKLPAWAGAPQFHRAVKLEPAMAVPLPVEYSCIFEISLRIPSLRVRVRGRTPRKTITNSDIDVSSTLSNAGVC